MISNEYYVLNYNSLRKIFSNFTALSTDAVINAVSFSFSHNTRQIYGNIVFIQLKRLNYETYYWENTKGHEVDFVIKKGLKVSQLIQVCYDISNIDTRSREINGLVFGLIHFNLPKGTIITSEYFHQETIEGKDIRYVPLWYWLFGIENSLT